MPEADDTMERPRRWALGAGAAAWSRPTGVREAAVLVRARRSSTSSPPEDVPGSCRVEDVGDLLVLPGLVDTHVHINDPGRADWEGFATATAARRRGRDHDAGRHAAQQLDPVTTTPEALAAKRAAAAGRLRVDCGFYGGLVPGNAGQIEPLADAGVLGFKAFLCHSGIDEFPNVDRGRPPRRDARSWPGAGCRCSSTPSWCRDVGAADGRRPTRGATRAWLASRPRVVGARGDPAR